VPPDVPEHDFCLLGVEFPGVGSRAPSSRLFGRSLTNARRVSLGYSIDNFMGGIDNHLNSRLFEDPDATTIFRSVMRFAKRLRAFDFARCGRNKSHAAVSDVKF